MKTLGLILSIFILCPILVIAQSNSEFAAQDSIESRIVKHFSVGMKAGSPIGLGGSAEVVIPILGNRIAPYLDLSSLNDLVVDDVSIGHKYAEYGLNIYFSDQARGLYLGLGMSSTSTDFEYSGQVSDSGRNYVGVATTSLDLELFNVKLGLKTGGTFFFRLEVGYGIGDIPQELEITGTTEFMGMTQTETSIEEIPGIPGISEDGMLVFNIGIGLSF